MNKRVELRGLLPEQYRNLKHFTGVSKTGIVYDIFDCLVCQDGQLYVPSVRTDDGNLTMYNPYNYYWNGKEFVDYEDLVNEAEEIRIKQSNEEN